MPFGSVTTLYLPIAANAGASQWGTDVRRLRDVADATADATTQTNHGTGAAVVRTADPYSLSAADSDQTLFGWAVPPADMGSVAGARRFYPAGTHTATLRWGHNGATGIGATVTAYAYRVGPAPGRARTLLGSGTFTTNLPATSGDATFVVPITLPEVIFEADETIQYSFEISAGGVAVVGRIAHLYTGTQGGVASRIDTPKLGILRDTTGTATAGATVAGTSGKVLATAGSAAGLATVAGSMGARADTTGAATSAAAVAGQGSSVAGAIGAAAGSATVAGAAGKVVGAVGTVEIGAGESAPAPVIRPVFIFDD